MDDPPQFTACDPVAKWTCAHRRATAHNAKRFLDKADMPFPVQAVDGGSEFKADFERECQERGLFELPPPELNGHVERNNGAWRYEATWDLPNDDLEGINQWAFADEFNTFRPHQALDGRTPAEYLQSLTAKETPAHSVSYVVN